MARFEKGPFAGFTGRLGGLVGYYIGDKHVVRTIGAVTKPPTIKQLAVRQKMAVVTRILKPMLPFVNIGFEFITLNTDRNAFNEATSYNLKNATTGVYPDIAIDYSKVLISAGNLMPAINPSINIMPDGIEFTWEVNTGMDLNIKNDRAMLLMYFPEKNEVIYILSGEQRYTGRNFIKMAPAYLNQQIEAYISFLADNKKSISNSVYIAT